MIYENLKKKMNTEFAIIKNGQGHQESLKIKIYMIYL